MSDTEDKKRQCIHIAWMRAVARASAKLPARMRRQVTVEVWVVDLSTETGVFLRNGNLRVLASWTSPAGLGGARVYGR